MTLVRPDISTLVREETPNPLEGLSVVTDAIHSYRVSQALFCALDRKVFTHLADSSREGIPANLLADRLSVPAHRLNELLICVSGMGLVNLEGDRFRNTQPADAFLVEGSEFSQTDYALYHRDKLYPEERFLRHHLASGQEQLKGLSMVNTAIHAYRKSQAVFEAVENKLFTQLANSRGGISADSLAREANSDPEDYRELLSALFSSGLITFNEGRFKNTPPSEAYLVEGSEFSQVNYAQYHKDRLYLKWGLLGQKVFTNGSSKPNPMYEKNDTGKKGTLFSGLDERAKPTGEIISEKVDLSQIDTLRYKPLLDLGGASGAMSIQLANAYPALQAIVYDRATPLELAKRNIEQAGLRGSVSTMEGDFLTEELPRCGAILASRIICDRSEEVIKVILERGREALLPGGALIINEFMYGSGDDVAAAYASLNLGLENGGRSYSVGDVKRFLSEVGFKKIQHISMKAPGGNGLVIGHKI